MRASGERVPPVPLDQPYNAGVTTNGHPLSEPSQRVERDSMGPLEVPRGAYYGASTQRAVQNFPISGERFDRRFIWALGSIKHAAALANRDLGLLDARKAEAIAQAAAGAGQSAALDTKLRRALELTTPASAAHSVYSAALAAATRR